MYRQVIFFVVVLQVVYVLGNAVDGDYDAVPLHKTVQKIVPLKNEKSKTVAHTTANVTTKPAANVTTHAVNTAPIITTPASKSRKAATISIPAAKKPAGKVTTPAAKKPAGKVTTPDPKKTTIKV